MGVVDLIRRLLAVAGVTCALAACASRTAPHHVLRIADGAGDPASLNPHLAMSATIDDIGSLALAYLMRYGPDGRLVPELITEIPSRANGGVSADGRRITWHLRHGVRWSDGVPFDARDVAFSVEAVLNPRNAEAGGTTGWDRIAAVETPDRFTVVYRLKEPYAALIPMSFTPVGGGPSVLPAHAFAGLSTIDHAPYNARPVGIGPFRITAWKRGESVDMEANPYYFRGRPRLARVVYALIASRETVAAQLRSGELDLWANVPPTYARDLAGEGHLRSVERPSLRTTHLDFAMATGALADRAARRAIRLAIDRRLLVRNVEHGAGLITDGIVWPGAPVVRDDPDAAPFDPALANRILDADGWVRGSDGVRARHGRRLALRLAYQAGAQDIASLVEVVRAGLRPIGVELITHAFAHEVLFGPLAQNGVLARGDFDATIYASTIVSLPDLASNFDCAMAPPHGENYGRWCDARVDALLARMRRSYDEPAVHAAFGALDRIFVDEVPSIQLFVWKGTSIANARVRGFRPNILTNFDDMLEVDD